jgi:hypothetical protein
MWQWWIQFKNITLDPVHYLRHAWHTTFGKLDILLSLREINIIKPNFLAPFVIVNLCLRSSLICSAEQDRFHNSLKCWQEKILHFVDLLHVMILGKWPTWRTILSVYLFFCLTLYMFRAHRAHHQERQIVSRQPLVAVNLCQEPCRMQVGSDRKRVSSQKSCISSS